MSAVFSPCRTWRYTLTRDVAVPLFTDVPRLTVAFIGLNPSTADETKNDPTVTRCIGFAQRWGYERMVMLNAFAFRATDPKALHLVPDPVGPENDRWIAAEVARADRVVCAWGIHATLARRGEAVRALVEGELQDKVGEQRDLYVLGLTKHGYPKHPLYLPCDLEPVPWS